MQIYPETLVLPEEFNLGIGRIVVAYANLENKLRTIVNRCAGIGPKEGRVLQISRRAPRYLDLIKDLLKARGKDVDLTKQPGHSHSLSDLLKIAEDERNRLVHGVWVTVPGYDRPVLQVVEGSWKLPDNSVALRKIRPQGWLLGDEYLKSVLEHLEVCHLMVQQFHERIEAILRE